MEPNVFGEICSLAQEEEATGLSDWQLQQTAAQKMMRKDLIEIIAISIRNLGT
jgi:hypothetical protein